MIFGQTPVPFCTGAPAPYSGTGRDSLCMYRNISTPVDSPMQGALGCGFGKRAGLAPHSFSQRAAAIAAGSGLLPAMPKPTLPALTPVNIPLAGAFGADARREDIWGLFKRGAKSWLKSGIRPGASTPLPEPPPPPVQPQRMPIRRGMLLGAGPVSIL
jgi:hypothetical protein